MLLSHQGGWDETLTVLLPLTLISVVFWLAARRAKNADHGTRPDEPEADNTTGSG